LSVRRISAVSKTRLEPLSIGHAPMTSGARRGARRGRSRAGKAANGGV
jgi:hypothetical protein